jgi:signal transduction histidine kinase
VLDHGCPVTNGNARVANFVAIHKRGVSNAAVSLYRFVQIAVNAMEGHAAPRLVRSY